MDLPEGVSGTYIQIQILQGSNGFGLIAEVETYNKTSYTTAENNLILAQNKLEKTKAELAKALEEVGKLKAEAAKNAEKMEENM